MRRPEESKDDMRCLGRLQMYIVGVFVMEEGSWQCVDKDLVFFAHGSKMCAGVARKGEFSWGCSYILVFLKIWTDDNIQCQLQFEC